MPVREVTPEEFLGGRTLVISARPFHENLKKLSREKSEKDRDETPSKA